MAHPAYTPQEFLTQFIGQVHHWRGVPKHPLKEKYHQWRARRWVRGNSAMKAVLGLEPADGSPGIRTIICG